MSKIVVFISRNDILQREVAKGLAKEFQEVDTMIIAADSLDNVKRRLKNLGPGLLRVSRVVAVNTNCDNLTNEIPGFLQMIDFCLNPRPELHAITIKPYISLVEILVMRIKSLSIETKSLEASILIPKKDLRLMAQLHNLSFDQVLQLLSEHLKAVGIVQGYVLPTDNAITMISIVWKGLVKGCKKDHAMNLKLEYSPVQDFSSYVWQIMAFLSLFINGVLQPVGEANIVPMLGLNEGLYAYLLSKLIEYGGEYRVEIS